jgi:ABC-type uncharacterized transport system substrate-binding protein
LRRQIEFHWPVDLEIGQSKAGLFSYGPDAIAMSARAANYIDKIFKGANSADLPVEQPAKFELIINLTTAKALGLTIPYSVSFTGRRIARVTGRNVRFWSKADVTA